MKMWIARVLLNVLAKYEDVVFTCEGTCRVFCLGCNAEGNNDGCAFSCYQEMRRSCLFA